VPAPLAWGTPKKIVYVIKLYRVAQTCEKRMSAVPIFIIVAEHRAIEERYGF
jgi:hypothetical protein